MTTNHRNIPVLLEIGVAEFNSGVRILRGRNSRLALVTVCACTVKIWQKITESVVMLEKFASKYGRYKISTDIQNCLF